MPLALEQAGSSNLPWGFLANIKYRFRNYHDMDTVTISKEEYLRLKKKAALADDVVTQLEKSFQDMRKGKVSKWKD